MSDRFDIAVVGATGVVGESILELLSARKFPLGKVYALASERSVGNNVNFGNGQLIVEDLAEFDFSKVQIGGWKYDVLEPGYKYNLTDISIMTIY